MLAVFGKCLARFSCLAIARHRVAMLSVWLLKRLPVLRSTPVPAEQNTKLSSELKEANLELNKIKYENDKL